MKSLLRPVGMILHFALANSLPAQPAITTAASSRSSLWLVGEYRAVPLYTRPLTSVDRQPVSDILNEDIRLSGAALGADVRLRLFRDWVDVAYCLRVRYDHLFFEPSSGPGIQRSVNALTADHLFMVRLNIKLKESNYLFFAGGGGYMNRGSDFTYSTSEVLPDGGVIYYTTTANFHYTSTIAALGVRLSRFECGVTGFYNGGPNELEPRSPYWVLAFHAGYRLTK